MTKTGAERRTSRRIPLKMLVQFRMDDMNEFLREHAVNVSAGGIFIRTSKPHPEGSMIYLQFCLTDGGKLIEGLGKVVHVNPPDSAAPGMGVEFVNLDDESQGTIDQIIAERNAELAELMS